MQRFNEAESLFMSDIFEKKKETASRISSQKFRRLGKGSIKFASDLMNPKERKQHTKAGKVLTSNIYDTILTVDEFEKLEEFEQRNRLAYLRTKYDNLTIMKEMGVSNARYYAIVGNLGLPKATRTYSDKKPKRKATAIAIAEEPIQAPIEKSTAAPIEKTTAPVQELIIDGLHLVYNGTFSPDMIVKQMLKFAALLEDENDQFHIELKLMQKPKTEEN